MNLLELIRYKVAGLRYIPSSAHNLCYIFDDGPYDQARFDEVARKHGIEEAKIASNYNARTFIGWMLAEIGVWFLDWNPGPVSPLEEAELEKVYEMVSSIRVI